VKPLEFYLFNFGSYPCIPHADELPKSAYIDLPNSHYEPGRGQWYLDSYLDTLAFGEKLGFDGILTTTQLNGPIGMTPSPNIPLAWLAARTERILLGSLGPVMNAYASPLRLAEEIALLDNISGGRVFTGLPMGHGMNYHSIGVSNPTLARERYWEGHDLIIKAWTEPGPFEWIGKHFHIPYVNLWPRPISKPHPDIWIPATGSKETLDKVAKHHYTYQAFFSPRKVLIRNVRTFREAAQSYGYEPDPKQIAAVVFVHVAESDKQARLEAEPHLLWLMQNTVRSAQHDSFPPGQVSVNSLRAIMSGGGYRDRDISLLTYDELVDEGWAIVGSPSTVAEKLEELVDDLGAGRLIHVADMGGMPNWMVRKSLTLMAEQVIPRFRGPGARPIWAEDPRPFPTHAEFGAAHQAEPAAIPEARLDGEGVFDVRVGHVADLRTPLRP
jgi:alkanesulfonate monooxygenase SsuD/methylene tetrahydromethanopterin reductase-like flavin-dependent oxidoreductase (luciferase family)